MSEPCKYAVYIYCDIYGGLCQFEGKDPEKCDFFDNGDGALYGEG